MTKKSLWWITGVLLTCGLPQANATGLASETTLGEGRAEAAIWVTDSLAPSTVGTQCSVTRSDCMPSSDCGDAFGRGGGLFGGGGLLGSDIAGETPWSVWLWAAPTYMSTPGRSLLGFSEGVNLGYRFTDNMGLYGSIGFNHTSRSTHILGTVGIQKFGNPEGDGLLERSTVWVLWDQGTETEFDSYLHQFRFMVGYSLGEYSEVGMGWSIPTSGSGGIGGALVPLGGPGYLTSASSFIGPYVKRRVRDTDLTGMIGYSDGGGGVALGVAAERPMTERANVYVDFKAGEGSNYAGSVGVAFGLGRADTKWH